MYIYLNVCKQMTDIKLLLLHSNMFIPFNCVQKISPCSFKNDINKMCLRIIYLMYMYKQDLTLNNLQWLICQKTKPNQTNYEENGIF